MFITLIPCCWAPRLFMACPVVSFRSMVCLSVAVLLHVPPPPTYTLHTLMSSPGVALLLQASVFKT